MYRESLPNLPFLPQPVSQRGACNKATPFCAITYLKTLEAADFKCSGSKIICILLQILAISNPLDPYVVNMVGGIKHFISAFLICFDFRHDMRSSIIMLKNDFNVPAEFVTKLCRLMLPIPHLENFSFDQDVLNRIEITIYTTSIGIESDEICST